MCAAIEASSDARQAPPQYYYYTQLLACCLSACVPTFLLNCCLPHCLPSCVPCRTGPDHRRSLCQACAAAGGSRTYPSAPCSGEGRAQPTTSTLQCAATVRSGMRDAVQGYWAMCQGIYVMFYFYFFMQYVEGCSAGIQGHAVKAIIGGPGSDRTEYGACASTWSEGTVLDGGPSFRLTPRVCKRVELKVDMNAQHAVCLNPQAVRAPPRPRPAPAPAPPPARPWFQKSPWTSPRRYHPAPRHPLPTPALARTPALHIPHPSSRCPIRLRPHQHHLLFTRSQRPPDSTPQTHSVTPPDRGARPICRVRLLRLLLLPPTQAAARHRHRTLLLIHRRTRTRPPTVALCTA